MTTRSRAVLLAMLCAASVTAQFVGAKATRDALFLTALPAAALPTMLIATAGCSLLLVAVQSRLASRLAPIVLVPTAFVLSGLLFVAEWLVRPVAPSATAVILYLHISGLGPLLASGFWLIATERFDPRTAKRGFGRIAGGGTAGGLLGGLLAERVAALYGVPAMLVVLAGFQFVTAWLVWKLAESDANAPAVAAATAEASVPTRRGLCLVLDTPPLRNLAALVLLGSTGAALLEYLFKAQAVEVLGPGDRLLRFFALYYAGTSLVTFVLQAFSTRTMLDRFGLALTASMPSIALLAGSLGSLLAPGFGGLLVARSGETIFRGSWFRAGYELFFTPMPSAEKRSGKAVIDVGFDRLGDALGGGLVRLAILVVPAAQTPAILMLAVATALGAIVVSSTLNRWYLRTLERSLRAHGRAADDPATIFDSLRTRLRGRASDDATTTATLRRDTRAILPSPALDPELRAIQWLKSGNRQQIVAVLSNPMGIAGALVPHVIPLLAREHLASQALFALRKVAEERVGELVDALLDPNQDFAVRRRLARVFSVCVSQRAADGLLMALDDERFDVRFQAARSLGAIVEKNPRVTIERQRVIDIVLREVEVDRPVWESRRLLDGFVSQSPLDGFVRDRAGQSLAHVFTLLSLILPSEPLQIAFRSLQADDAHLRGTALEYLEEVLPPAVREGLWPFLVRRRSTEPVRPHDNVIANLLRSSESVTIRALAQEHDAPVVAGFSAL